MSFKPTPETRAVEATLVSLGSEDIMAAPIYEKATCVQCGKSLIVDDDMRADPDFTAARRNPIGASDLSIDWENQKDGDRVATDMYDTIRHKAEVIGPRPPDRYVDVTHQPTTGGPRTGSRQIVTRFRDSWRNEWIEITAADAVTADGLISALNEIAADAPYWAYLEHHGAGWSAVRLRGGSNIARFESMSDAEWFADSKNSGAVPAR